MKTNEECFECGASADEYHHVVPQSVGGTKTVPLCGKCHCLVHDFGGRRDQGRELTTRALNKKKPFEFHYVWWHHFKCAGEDDWKDIKELADDLDVTVDPIRKRVARIKVMDTKFLEELCLPYAGYEYYGTSIFNLEPFDLTNDDIVAMKNNRKKIDENIMKELGMTA